MTKPKALFDGAPTGQADSAEDERQGRHQYQTLRNHGGNGRRDHPPQFLGRDVIGRQKQHEVETTQTDGDTREDAQQLVNGDLERTGGGCACACHL